MQLGAQGHGGGTPALGWEQGTKGRIPGTQRARKKRGFWVLAWHGAELTWRAAGGPGGSTLTGLIGVLECCVQLLETLLERVALVVLHQLLQTRMLPPLPGGPPFPTCLFMSPAPSTQSQATGQKTFNLAISLQSLFLKEATELCS